MSSTQISTVSTGVSLSSGEVDAGDETYSSSSYSSETSVYLGEISGTGGDGLGAGVLADATAFGTDTFAEVGISATAVDGTYVDSVTASVDAVSVSQSSGDDAFASTTAAIDIYGEADVFLGISHTSTTTVADETGTTAIAETSASIVALDFSTDSTSSTSSSGAETAAPETGLEGTELVQPAAYEGIDCGCDATLDDGYDMLQIDGNLAVFEIDASAFGDDTFTDVSVDAIALEDELSLVTAVVVVAID